MLFMKSWIKNKLKPYYSVPKEHTIDQVVLLLESNMPYNIIAKTLKLSYQTLDDFTQAVYRKQNATFKQLRESFSMQQLLILFKQLYSFKQLIKTTIIKKSMYPCTMMFLSYAVFLMFYFMIYPLFLSMSNMSKNVGYLIYVYLSFFIIVLSVLMFGLFIHIFHSHYQSTLLLRSLHTKKPTLLIFDYYTIVFVLIYGLCLKNRYSSLMTIELIRGLHDTPFLKALAYDIELSCEKGKTLHQAIKEQQLSMLLNQTIDLGIAADDLSMYINNLAATYQQILASKLSGLTTKFNLVCYGFVLLHCGLIINILQMPTKLISDSF